MQQLNPSARPQIEMRSPIDLVPYVNNARTHSKAQVEQIARSIERFGFTNPVLIDDEDGIIAVMVGWKPPNSWDLMRCQLSYCPI